MKTFFLILLAGLFLFVNPVPAASAPTAASVPVALAPAEVATWLATTAGTPFETKSVNTCDSTLRHS